MAAFSNCFTSLLTYFILNINKTIRTMSEEKQSNRQSSSNVNEFNRYLNNNTDILKEKFKEYYGQPFPLARLNNQQQLEDTLQFIYDIFNFTKYESNESLNNTLRSSLIANTQSFIEENKSKIQTFDGDIAIQLLKYCIEHNDMFAVSYDKKKPNKPNPPVKQEPKVQQQKMDQNVKIEQQPKVEEEANKEQRVEPQTPKINEREEEKASEKQLNQMTMSNEFGPPPQLERQENEELIKKQLKGVFQFYCKQQQNIGPNFTFDNINHKCQTMNLGKFVAFAVAANLVYSREKVYSEGKLEKNQIISIFKKVAAGQREIGFPVFLKIMQELKKSDSQIYQRLGLGEEGSKGLIKLTEKLKYINLPFGTRDATGRESSRYSKVFVPKLTSHSGKSEEALRDELLSRRQKMSKEQILERHRMSSKLSMSRNMISSIGNHEKQEKAKFTLKLGESNDMEQNDLNFLSKLITQQENDQIFLKDYKLPNSKPSRERAQSNSYDQGRLQNQTESSLQPPKLFAKNLGGFTTRTKKQQDFVLPSISKRGGNTENGSDRRSMGPPRKGAPRILLH